MTDLLWDNIRVWYPPFSKNGTYYHTKVTRKYVKNGKGTVEMELIQE